ncbi:MAG: NnrU family protein [Planctomycetota bacterium]
MSESTALSARSTAAAAISPARVGAFGYGMTAYFVGVSGLVALILLTLYIVPFTGGPIQIEGTGAKIAFNLGLIAVFGIQHAIMAREGFKKKWTTVISPAVERATFTGIAGVLMLLIVWLSRPLPEVLWAVQNETVRAGLLGLCAFGWVYLLAATFAIDHFELFGVKQVWRNLTGKATPAPGFKERFMYRFDRHPIMTGVLLGLWSAPTMTLDRLVLCLGFTSYIVLGVTIEERDLRRRLGATYAEYAGRVRTVVPTLRAGK